MRRPKLNRETGYSPLHGVQYELGRHTGQYHWLVIQENMKILHVTEAFGSGVLNLIAILSRRQAEAGAQVSVLYSSRPDTPSDAELQHIFDPRVQLIRVTDRGASRATALLKLRSTLRRELSRPRYDAVHLHSTFAGAIGRIGIGRSYYRSRTFYSPHGFAFLRHDVSARSRKLMLLAERVGARRGALVLTTHSEFEIAQEKIKRAKCWMVVNGIDTSDLPIWQPHERQKPRVGMAGRITYQKAPWKFAAIARELNDEAEFIWFGDGTDDDKDRWLGAAPVEVTGWMPLRDLRERLADLDIFLFPSLWEGMPLSLIEAQAIGVPSVSSSIMGNKDIVISGSTGYLCEDDEGLLLRTRELVANGPLRIAMSGHAIAHVRTRFDDRSMGTDSIRVYVAFTQSGAATSDELGNAHPRQP